ncbi:Cyclin, C-terminal domain [Musa troglodytarum]|uniref:Cyclin, C-terminal domain n=1 Tax=Musa troglodytarum TaxID=320322 RepID=A0A9E7HDU7_9LILI|nr:Cyclin, C-terminal domain [Musa troglodytarum]URE31397.1 Cyclin, C-terminal domain [Musa troglodytarum]
MDPSYDSASSILLRAEDNSSIMSFGGDEEGGHGFDRVPEVKSWDFYGDLFVDFPLLSDECVGLLVEKETEHMPRDDYAEKLRSGALYLSIRRDAIDWIWKVHAHYNFGPVSACLAVNYLDQFLSAYELPQGKAWMTQLLSVACLSLAAKMEETEVPLSMDLQVGDAKYVFEARTIQRMELLVLATLKWRMQAVTPFSFIDFFLHKFNGGNAPSNLLVSRSVEAILITTRGTGSLAFRPSEIAAAIALSVLKETQTIELEKALSCCSHVVKEGVLRCHEMIQDLMAARKKPLEILSPSVSSLPQSPVGVLDAACLSYKIDDTVSGSHATSDYDSPASKRRKISRSSIS